MLFSYLTGPHPLMQTVVLGFHQTGRLELDTPMTWFDAKEQGGGQGSRKRAAGRRPPRTLEP